MNLNGENQHVMEGRSIDVEVKFAHTTDMIYTCNK